MITRGSRSGMIRGWLIPAEGHTTAREKGITALECRRRQKKGGHHGKWKGHDGNCRRCRRVIRGLSQYDEFWQEWSTSQSGCIAPQCYLCSLPGSCSESCYFKQLPECPVNSKSIPQRVKTDMVPWSQCQKEGNLY